MVISFPRFQPGYMTLIGYIARGKVTSQQTRLKLEKIVLENCGK